MKSLPLFITKREIFYTFLAIVALFGISLFYEFYKYKKVTTYSLHVATVKVLNQYEKKSKKGKIYTVLKLKSEDFTFYTTYWKPLEVERGDTLRVIFHTKQISFFTFLKGFYANTKSLHVVNRAEKSLIVEFIENQHTSELSKELYKALFLAIPVSKELREDVAKWGLAHLVAISGFHLGILSAILFFLLKPLYTFFQDRWFPYRNRVVDIALLIFLILGSYVYLIDMVPSVIRAYTMSLIGFFLFSRNIKIISFGTLLFTISIVLILFPHLLFSIAFWFSVCGVFYIFLFLYHFSHLNKILIFALLNIWVYILMTPVIHYFFDIFSLHQLLSPLISMAFAPFYIASLALHFVGLGEAMDSFLIWLFSVHVEVIYFKTPLWFLVIYLLISLVAIRIRLVAFFLPVVAMLLSVV